MKTWVIGKMADDIDRNFIDIKTNYRKNGVFYTKEMFVFENKQAIKVTDKILITMILWYDLFVIFMVELIIARLKAVK